jgi:Ca-activated chloride channel family protein
VEPKEGKTRRRRGSPCVRRQAAVLFLSALFLLGASCSGAPGKLKIVEGNFFTAQGMYTKAIAAYRASLAFTGAAPYGEYGLGLIYLSLDEDAAALERFTAAEQSLKPLGGEEHRELRYRIHYNRGVIRFRNGDYAGAAGEFRQALEADSSYIEAKRNLELSLLSLNRQDGAGPVPLANQDAAGKEDGAQDAVQNSVLFDYLRRKEQDRWRSRELVENTPASGPDY